MKRTLWLIASILVTGTAIADRWGPSPAERVSPDGKLILTSKADKNYKLTLTLKRKEANGWRTLWSIPSPQRSGPYKVHFAANGQATVFENEWGNLGNERSLVFLGPKGQVLRSYSLKALLPEDEIYRHRRTISSTWWTDGAALEILNNGTWFAFATRFGTYRCFDLATGKAIALGYRREAVRQELIAKNRPRLASKDPAVRGEAVERVGTLQDRASLPLVRKMLNDPAHQSLERIGEGIPSGSYETYYVQIQAGRAFLALVPAEAIAFFEKKIVAGPANNAYDWVGLLAEAPPKLAKPVWLRLRKSRSKWLANYAKQVLEGWDYRKA